MLQQSCPASLPCIAPPTHDPPPDRHGLATRQTLDLTLCEALTSLPAELGRLTSLRTLNLDYCRALTGMPDLSGLPQLQARRTMAVVG